MSTTKWAIDPMHSEIGFKVKHMMFTTISGKFSKFEASIESENDSFENAKIEFTAIECIQCDLTISSQCNIESFRF